MNRSDFFTEERRDGIVILWIENKREGINIVSPDLIPLIGEVLDDLLADASVKGIVFISKLNDFMAGADVKGFEIEKEGEFKPIQAKGHELLERMETAKIPSIAAIHGNCVGLGLELALGCDYRIASNAPSTKLALPEVKLGILPGGGGTQRLPRTVGIQKALDMMLTGKNIFAYQAKKMGLVDDVVDQHKLLDAALKIIQKGKKKDKGPKLSFKDKMLEGNPIGRNIVFNQARKMAAKQTKGNYPAVPAIIDCVEAGYKNGIKAGYQKELDLFEKLILTPESNGLRNLFYIMTNNKKGRTATKELKTLGMIGAGLMGGGIAEISVKNGIDTYLKDIRMDGILKTKETIWKGLLKKIKYKTLRKVEAEQVMSRLTGTMSYDGFENADIVIEAVLEKMDLKKRIIDDIQNHGNSNVIIATNTSALSVTEMAEYAKEPSKVIGMHYFSPVPKMPLLEIVRTKYTDEEVINSCYQFGVKQGKTVIVVNDCPGFYVNRILIPYLNECMLMVDEGVSIDAINKAMENKGFPVGPFKLMDEVGLDVAAHVAETGRKAAESRPEIPVNLSVQKMFEDKLYGKKSGKGFFLYDEKGKRKGTNPEVYKYFKGNGDKSIDEKLIQDRALFMMLNEAMLAMEDNTIDSAITGDTGAVFGIGFLPFTGGPFRFMDSEGLEKISARFSTLEKEIGARFKQAKILTDNVQQNKSFHA